MAANGVSVEEVKRKLAQVKYPGYSRDIVSFGMVKEVKVAGKKVTLALQYSTQSPEVRKQIEEQARAAVASLAGVEEVKIGTTQAEEKKSTGKTKIAGVEHTIAVASGKGGVGKSTVAVNLALALSQLGCQAGILDADIYGPSIPLMLGVNEMPQVTPDHKLVPLERYGLKVMSIGFFVEETSPVIWRGPLVMQMVKQFLTGVHWRGLDFLVIDLPPGTGDAQLTLVQTVPITGAVVVTTPQDVALLDAKKAVKMFEKVQVPVFGIVENMSYFLCPHCHERTDIFSHGGGKEASQLLGVDFLGEIPLDIAIRASGDKGEPVVVEAPDSAQAQMFKRIALAVLERVNGAPQALSL